MIFIKKNVSGYVTIIYYTLHRIFKKKFKISKAKNIFIKIYNSSGRNRWREGK